MDVRYPDEEPWTQNPLALIWPPRNILRISPFQRELGYGARLNAHARLTMFIGFSIFFLTTRTVKDKQNGVIVLFWTLLFVINQGVSFMYTEEGRYQARLERIQQAEQVRKRRDEYELEMSRKRWDQMANEWEAYAANNAQQQQQQQQQAPQTQIFHKGAFTNDRENMTLMQRWIMQYGSAGNMPIL